MIKPLAILLLPAAILTAGDIREEVLVSVNNHFISRRTLAQSVEQETAALYRKHSGKELDEKLRDTREKTLQNLIDFFLLEDKATDLNITIGEEDMRGMVENLKKQNQFTTDADLDRALRTSLGVGINDFLKRARQNEIQRQVMSREVFSKIAIEDQELRAWYEDHKDEYKQPSRFRIRELVLAKGATPEEKAAAKTKLDEIQAALKSGKTFEELVRSHSTSPSKSVGGDLGWINKGLLRGDIEAAALALKPDQVSTPVETDKDICLVQLIASEINAVKPFEDVKQQIMEKLQEPKAQNAIEHFMSGLRSRGNIRYLVPKEQILKG
jgi:parvulin-like peptidyl-prolyl isomerase